ncbi:MAG: fumarylacetoacetate hydrolase family protein, partial [Pseudomonadota bacterium]
MTNYPFSPPQIAVVPTTDGMQFPVRRIFCIGKNYADHVREMGGTPETTPPVFFTKSADAVICPTGDSPWVDYPPATNNLHYEAEIVLALKSGGRDIQEVEAMTHVYGMAMGCDLTRRDLQALAREKRGPWDVAKAFDQGAVISPIQPGNTLGGDVAFSLSVNGQTRQQTIVAKMIYPAPRIVA